MNLSPLAIELLCQLYLAVLSVWLGVRDGRSFEFTRRLSEKQMDAWHFDGGAIYAIAAIPTFFFVGWISIAYALLIRGSLFDIGYNAMRVNVPIGYIGDAKQWLEKQNVKVFGKFGAVKKAAFYIAIIITINILKFIFFE
jgi:hypothetical protein